MTWVIWEVREYSPPKNFEIYSLRNAISSILERKINKNPIVRKQLFVLKLSYKFTLNILYTLCRQKITVDVKIGGSKSPVTNFYWKAL